MINNLGFMQGRLSELIDGKIQAFPKKEWENEFSRAFKIDLSILEWTLDQIDLYKNPLMNKSGRSLIRYNSEKYRIKIPSLTGDCFMQEPFWKADHKRFNQLTDDFTEIISSCSLIGIKYIVIPLVDNGRIENIKQENCLLDFLLKRMDMMREKKVVILFESDLIPKELFKFINKFPVDIFGINYDIGNSAASNFNPIDEFNYYGDRIRNIHIKDRLKGGSTVELGTGNANFDLVFSLLSDIKYKDNLILQTARDNRNDHIGAIIKYKKFIIDLISKYP